MSDNLKVAKECGTFKSAEERLASLQAAHEAEIAKLKEENARQHKEILVYHESRLALIHEKEALSKQLSAANERIAYLEGLVAHQADAFMAIYADVDSLSRVGKVAYAALSASPQQVSEWERKQLAEAEQRGAVKTLEELQGLFIKWYVIDRELRLVCESDEKREAITRLMIGATSKQSGG